MKYRKLTSIKLWIYLIFSPTGALKMVVEAAVAGASVLSLCEKGDSFIMEEIGKIFKKEKEMKKGQQLATFHLTFDTSFTLVFYASAPSSFNVGSFAGIAFPTCLSVNNCVCHFSPVKSDPDVILKDGDVVKM